MHAACAAFVVLITFLFLEGRTTKLFCVSFEIFFMFLLFAGIAPRLHNSVKKWSQ